MKWALAGNARRARGDRDDQRAAARLRRHAHDPVGRLSPVANLPLLPATGTTTSPVLTTPIITIPSGGDDKHSGGADD